MDRAELLQHVRNGHVHRSSDGRAWLALPGNRYQRVPEIDQLGEYVWFQRNAAGWWALARLTRLGEDAVGRRTRPRTVAADLTPEATLLAVRLYRNGESMRRTARALQTSEPKIRKILAEAGVELRRPGRRFTREEAS